MNRGDKKAVAVQRSAKIWKEKKNGGASIFEKREKKEDKGKGQSAAGADYVKIESRLFARAAGFFAINRIPTRDPGGDESIPRAKVTRVARGTRGDGRKEGSHDEHAQHPGGE